MSDAPGLDERLHRAAIKAALNPLAVYDPDEVPGSEDSPGTATTPYVILRLERRPSPANVAGRSNRSGWRVVTECVGRNLDEVDGATLDVALALQGSRLTIDGTESTPLVFDIAEMIQPPAGALYARSVEHTYAL